jgi:hypothetical protein
MKQILIPIIALSSIVQALAGNQQFHITPFSQIVLTNDEGREKVDIVMGNKFEENSIYKAKLKAMGNGVYQSLDGVTLAVKDLAKPVVVNKGLRWEFKSSRKITITGSGKVYDKLFKELSLDNPETKELVFYEEIYEK